MKRVDTRKRTEETNKGERGSGHLDEGRIFDRTIEGRESVHADRGRLLKRMEENECRNVRGEENVGSSNGGRVYGRGVLERVAVFFVVG